MTANSIELLIKLNLYCRPAQVLPEESFAGQAAARKLSSCSSLAATLQNKSESRQESLKLDRLS